MVVPSPRSVTTDRRPATVNEWRYNQSLEAAKLKHFENFDNMEERLKKKESFFDFCEYF
jgi:hypothetical protein